MRSYGKNLTTGNVFKKILGQAIPIMLSSSASYVYNLVNILLVSTLMTSDILASIGVVFPLMSMITAVSVGISLASSIQVSKAYGENNNKLVNKILVVSFSYGTIFIFALLFILFILSKLIILNMNIPIEIQSTALLYFRVQLCGYIFVHISYYLRSIFRAVGDTKMPILFVITGIFVNFVLDIYLIPVLGIVGVAIAYIVSKITMCIIEYIYLCKKYKGTAFNISGFSMDTHIIKKILKTGIPIFLQQLIMPFSFFIVSTSISKYGTSVISAYTIFGRVEALVVMMATSVSLALSAFVSQNLGANKPNRIKKGVKYAICINVIAVSIISVLIINFPREIMGFFTTRKEVIEVGVTYLGIAPFFYCLYSISYSSIGLINGLNMTIYDTIISFTTLILVRGTLIYIISTYMMDIRYIWCAISIGIIVSSVFHSFFISYIFKNKLSWRIN
jgi:putative MATE family efflux protein